MAARSINFGLILTGFHFRLAVFAPSHRDGGKNNWKSVGARRRRAERRERANCSNRADSSAKIDDLARERERTDTGGAESGVGMHGGKKFEEF